jgi:hypothetical protein
MAKGKKGGSGVKYVSKGERKSSISTRNTDAGQRLLNQLDALKKGKNVVIKVPGLKQEIDGKEWLARRRGVKTAESTDA